MNILQKAEFSTGFVLQKVTPFGISVKRVVSLSKTFCKQKNCYEIMFGVVLSQNIQTLYSANVS